MTRTRRGPTENAEYAHVAVVDGAIYVAWSEWHDGVLEVWVAVATRL
jgi:hypothetical protein